MGADQEFWDNTATYYCALCYEPASEKGLPMYEGEVVSADAEHACFAVCDDCYDEHEKEGG